MSARPHDPARRPDGQRSCRAPGILALVLAAGWPSASPAAPLDPLDNVVVTRHQDSATIRIVAACRTSYETHVPASAGIELRVTLRPGADCREFAPSAAGRVYQPVGRELGGIDEIAVDFAAAD
ncbi:MAG TPA: hypothetical protein VFY03_14055, partial [Woeseiaceae bacterium]|nr:hypothetical protein [Woeseiaceae bacterium]